MPSSAANKQIGLGLLLVATVSLLTLLFSFLGTIACAALFGMMIGANRSRPEFWKTALISLVFPSVLLVFVRGWKSDVTPHGAAVLCLICFVCFWLTYVLSWGMVLLEGTSTTASGTPPSTDGISLVAAGANGSRHRPHAERTTQDPELQSLQGVWCRRLNSKSQGLQLFHVTGKHSCLKVVEANGEARCLCEGELSVKQIGPYKVLTLKSEHSPDRNGFPLTSWEALYRVSGEVLTVAVNFEGQAQAPAVETYTRQPQSTA
jgi:hypothetical protein